MDGKEKIDAEQTVAFLGPPATFSHRACIEHFGDSVRMLPADTIQDVFDAVETEKADYGVVPVENSTEGPVSLTLDSFVQSEVKICGEIMTAVSHDLLSLSGDAWDMKKIYSHPQAFGQCREWLRKNFPYVRLEEAASTARAAQLALADSKAAAIAGSLAASLYGLKVVASRIEDQPNNFTRFLVLGRRGAGRTGKDKTSILFIVPHAPGTLFRVLQVFYEKRFNLTKIESRPNKEKPWEYIFFLDFEGHAEDPHVAQALDEVQERVLFVKLLGSYPQGSPDLST
jgi:chorismate mutase/prephenate dehydratase